MTKKTYTKTITTAKGFGKPARSARRQAIQEAGRAIIGVTKDDDQDALDFTYTIPCEGVDEPVLLTGYPSKNTVPWLLNALGDKFRGHDWRELSTDRFTQVDGMLGEGGLIPLNVRLLTPAERELCQESLTCQAPADLPVVWVQLPDPNGYFPTQEMCHPDVRVGDLSLYARFADV